MALFRDLGGQITMSLGATVTFAWVYPGAKDHGPQYISASFQGAEENYGTATTTHTSVVSFYDSSDGYNWPMGISYIGQIRNDSITDSIIIKLNIGTFE